MDASSPGLLVVENQRFAVVGEWVIEADLSDAAFRVYALLLRFGNTSGRRMPSRRLLADKLHRSVDSIDRAMRELVSAGVVRVEHRRNGRANLTNRYHVRTTDPSRARHGPGTPPGHANEAVLEAAERSISNDAPDVEAGPGMASRRSAATSSDTAAGHQLSGGPHSRRSAATPSDAAADHARAGTREDRNSAATRTTAAIGGRTTAATVAAEVRPDPDPLTQTLPPPPSAAAAGRASVPAAVTAALATCGTDLGELAGRCQQARRALGQPNSRWAGPCVSAAVQLALVRGWPADRVADALLAVAADPATRSPMRLAEAGPWWDATPSTTRVPAVDEGQLAGLEARLDALDGQRPALQARARAELQAEQLPVTRATVLQRACQILDRLNAGHAA